MSAQIFAFPKAPNIIQAEAEEYLRMEFRMNTAAACGYMTKPPSVEDIIAVKDRMAAALDNLDQLIAIKMACQ